MRVILKNFRIIDEKTDMTGTVILENGFISALFSSGSPDANAAAMIIDGSHLGSSGELPVLMPAFVDLHAHFRDLGSLFSAERAHPTELSRPTEVAFPSELSLPSEVAFPSELVESASLAAAAGGFGTVVCMANTSPAIDKLKKAMSLKKHSDALGFVDLYPVISLTKGMEGKELSEINKLLPKTGGTYLPLMLSEDGKDLADDELFLAAMKEAKRLGIPVSCHCDLGGDEAAAVRRVIELGKQALCHIHIAHVSTQEAIKVITQAKAESNTAESGTPQRDAFTLSCEVMPHHLCLTEEDAVKLGKTTNGRVNPPLRCEEDRQALIRALADETIDAIATDHAPHSVAAKEAGAPGFSGFETAFAAVYTELVRTQRSPDHLDLKRLSSLMSAAPARLLGLDDRGLIVPGHRADLVILDTEASWVVDPGAFKSRGKNSPFAGKELYGKVLMTLRSGQLVFSSS